MKRLAFVLLLLIPLAAAIALLARPGAEASPATYTVNSTADPGDGTCDITECTLREAIAAANASAGTDTIEFNIPGTGPHTIQPTSALPTITDPVTIDGTTEPDFSETPIVELDGSGAGAFVIGLYISGGGSSSTVRGLVINRFGGLGVIIDEASDIVIQGNYIGTDVTGVHDLGNASNGVGMCCGAQNNTIGGASEGERNVISGNNMSGVGIGDAGTSGNVVLGNYIGTDASGTFGMANGDDGVTIGGGAQNNTIGGSGPGEGNVISGNNQHGVLMHGQGTNGNVLKGNYIGTDVTGTADLGNGTNGVGIYGGAQNNTIGGSGSGEGNVISGNNQHGVLMHGQGTNGNVLKGNYIGTDVAGTADLGNGGNGVGIGSGPQSNTIGGASEGERNVISGNNWSGVGISEAGTSGNAVVGNYIGTDASGTSGMGNGDDGVTIGGGAQNNTIGGSGPGESNIIAFNMDDGVRVYGASTTLNTISGNSIHSNGWQGIDNVDGGNTELAPPVVDAVGSVSGHTDPKCYPCTVEVFSDDEDEGRIYHGSTTTNDDATGTWTYPGAVTGPNITATITDASGNTSEFSIYSPPVGGIAELPEVSDSADRNYVPLAALTAVSLVALSAGVWYTRRRWLG